MKNTSGFLNKNNTQLAGIALAGIGLFAVARALYRRATRLDYREKVVVITGGSRGLGLEMARILADQGAKLTLCARSEADLANAAAGLSATGAQVLTFTADLAEPEQAKRVIDRTMERYGRIDILINNAGIMALGPENVMELEDFRQVMDANCWSALHTIKAALPHFRAQGAGRIANVSSIGGKVSVPHMLPYSVSKFALTGLSEGLAAELKKDNILVTTVVPNLMRTGSPRNVSIKGAHEDEYAWFKIADSLPLLSQDARAAAEAILDGIAAGDSEVILTPIARAASILNGVAPGAVTTLMQWTNQFLPESTDTTVRKGHESESDVTKGMITAETDEAAVRNNEL